MAGSTLAGPIWFGLPMFLHRPSVREALCLVGVIAFLSGPYAADRAVSEARTPPREVDLALVLAIDVSASISSEENRLQLEGYARAFRDVDVLGAIADGGHGAIAVTVLEWANTRAPMPSVGWTLVNDNKSAEAFATMIERLPYHPMQGTSIGSAIAWAHRLLDEVPYRPLRRTIDISGDGKSMRESYLANVRQAALDSGITINGLPIGDDPNADLANYYDDRVIGGPDAFLVVAEGFGSFDQAIHQKLVREIADPLLGSAIRLARK